jgi:mannose-6-phosphate isomerase
MKDKKSTFERVAAMLRDANFTIVDKDDARPWGGFYVIDEAQAARFVQHYFAEENLNELKITNKLSPKILIVGPRQRLSWQYHHRRAEIWKCIGGTVAVMTSNTDEENTRHTLKVGDIIKLKQGERHRLIGLDDWGIVAEIWQHTDESNPSDEDDIVRLQDDYSRK